MVHALLDRRCVHRHQLGDREAFGAVARRAGKTVAPAAAGLRQPERSQGQDGLGFLHDEGRLALAIAIAIALALAPGVLEQRLDRGAARRIGDAQVPLRHHGGHHLRDAVAAHHRQQPLDVAHPHDHLALAVALADVGLLAHAGGHHQHGVVVDRRHRPADQLVAQPVALGHRLAVAAPLLGRGLDREDAVIPGTPVVVHEVRGMVAVPCGEVGTLPAVQRREDVPVQPRLQQHPPPALGAAQALADQLPGHMRHRRQAQPHAQQRQAGGGVLGQRRRAGGAVVDLGVAAVDRLHRLEPRGPGRVARRKRSGHDKAVERRRRVGADAAEHADPAAGLGDVVPQPRRRDRIGGLLQHRGAMHRRRHAGVQRDPGDPGIEQRRALHRRLHRPGALLAQPAEVRQEVLASLRDQPVDHTPVDLVELDQQHLVPDIHLHVHASPGGRIEASRRKSSKYRMYQGVFFHLSSRSRNHPLIRGMATRPDSGVIRPRAGRTRISSV